LTLQEGRELLKKLEVYFNILKMRKFIYILLILFGWAAGVSSWACTTVIVSASKTSSGKPLMIKNRDTDHLDNRIEYFRGPIYTFIGLVNSESEGSEVWAGTNSAGFCIMNTASYNLKDDDIPAELMDREGTLMFRALGVCATVSDFESFLNNISKPLYVEANFGIIDASGGAAYFEVKNDSWVKYDVNTIPEGYRVVTNFSESGREEDYKGYERWLTASDIMKDIDSRYEGGKMDIGPLDLVYGLSRSYKSTMTGMDWLNDYYSLKKDYGFNGIVVDQDLIPRRSTSSVVVFEGVKPGDNPIHTVMWTVLGYPCTTVCVPLLVGDSDMIPSYMKSSESSSNAWMCDLARKIKENAVFRFKVSNGSYYLDLNNVMELLHSCLVTESKLEGGWQGIYEKWMRGEYNFDRFKEDYSSFCKDYFDNYLDQFASFIQ
jgi:hypothetical protein